VRVRTRAPLVLAASSSLPPLSSSLFLPPPSLFSLYLSLSLALWLCIFISAYSTTLPFARSRALARAHSLLLSLPPKYTSHIHKHTRVQPLVAMEEKGKVDITIILDDTIEIAQQERSACSGNGRGEKRGVGVRGEGSRNVGRIRRDDTHTHTHTHIDTHTSRQDRVVFEVPQTLPPPSAPFSRSRFRPPLPTVFEFFLDPHPLPPEKQNNTLGLKRSSSLWQQGSLCFAYSFLSRMGWLRLIGCLKL